MAKELKRIRLAADTDLLRVFEDVRSDRVPRLIERAGEALAIVVSPEDYPEAESTPKSKRHKRALLALAGVWRDLAADEMIDELYKARHAAPPSAPVKL